MLVRISNLKATGSRQAFSVAGYASAPLQDVTFRNIEIEAQRAGEIVNAENWKFENVRLATSTAVLSR